MRARVGDSRDFLKVLARLCSHMNDPSVIPRLSLSLSYSLSRFLSFSFCLSLCLSFSPKHVRGSIRLHVLVTLATLHQQPKRAVWDGWSKSINGKENVEENEKRGGGKERRRREDCKHLEHFFFMHAKRAHGQIRHHHTLLLSWYMLVIVSVCSVCV